MKPELINITSAIYTLSQRLDKLPKAIYEAARCFAKAEAEYRMELSKELLRLKAEGMAVGILNDVARGNLALIKFERDLKEAEYRASLESAKVLQAEMSGLQSILRIQDEV